MNKADWIRGKTVEQILDLPFSELNKMTESQLRTTVGRLVSAGNKRLRRFEAGRGKLPNAGMQGGTYEEIKFSTVGKDKQQLLEEYKRARGFMRAETSSLTGVKKVEKKSVEALKGYGVNIEGLSQKNYDRFWQAYDKLKEVDKTVADKNYKYAVLNEMNKMVKGKKWFNVDKLVRDMQAKIETIYKENAQVANASGTSGFFEV